MNRFYILIFIALIIFNFFLGSWYQRHGDIYFSSDIGRDFLLFEEIQQKGLILIGARTSSGIFHGPLWLYVNMPAYLIGGGNPLVVGWYWIFLAALSLTLGFFIAKKLFNQLTAYLYVLILSLSYAFHTHRFLNPHGVMLIITIFFYAFIRYMQTLKIKYLIIYAVTVTAMVHFEVATGGPLLLLSLPIIIFKILKNKKGKHLSALLLIALGLSNYVLFDIRHDFLIAKKAIEYITIKNYSTPFLYGKWIQDRLGMIINIDFLNQNSMYKNFLISIFFFVSLFIQLKHKKYSLTYICFLYFYGGFLIISLLNQGNLLSFYIYPWAPLILLMFSSLATSRYKIIFFVVFGIIYCLNTNSAINDLRYASNTTIGKEKESWKFLSSLAQETFSTKEKEFGYFSYSPDFYGYSQKYAFAYIARQLKDKKAYYFTKKPVTFLFIEPPPVNNPYMLDRWWTENKLKINKQPITTKVYPNGYKVETYALTDNEVNIPTEPDIDPGIHFR